MKNFRNNFLTIYFQIYSYSGLRGSIRAESILVVGVKLVEMTEAKGDEWWILSSKTKQMIEARRVAWDSTPQYQPRVSKPAKVATRKRKPKQQIWTPLPPSSVTQVISTFGFFSHKSSQDLTGIMLRIPANSIYDSARAMIAKGLSAGGLRILWDQFPTGKFTPLPYDAFKAIFGPGWKLYDP